MSHSRGPGDRGREAYPHSRPTNGDSSSAQFGVHGHAHSPLADAQAVHSRHAAQTGMQSMMQGMAPSSVQPMGMAQQSLQWIPNPAMLREISAQGPGKSL